jgi:hypothetical protein
MLGSRANSGNPEFSFAIVQACLINSICFDGSGKEVLLVPPLFLLDSAESGGIRWSEIWQEGLLIFSFWCILSPAEFGQSVIETGMVCGLAKRHDTEIRLFVWHMPIVKQTIVAKQTIVCLAITLLIPHHHHHLPSSALPTFATTATS